jgi:peptidoglycan/xylan/chitin deacetylase (PgdA/CDA1 family)
MHASQYIAKVKVVFMGLILLILFSVFGIGAFVYFSSPSSAAFLARTVADIGYRLRYQLSFAGTQVTAGNEVSGTAQAIPVLLYHGEGAASDMPTDTFVDQMRALRDDGWTTVTMDQFKKFISDGAPLPAKSFVLTFDDGRKDTFYGADPVLKETGFNAVMFVITGFSMPSNGAKTTYYLDQAELTYMAQSGRWDLESHGDQDHALYQVPPASTATSSKALITQQHFISNKFWIKNENRIETDEEYQSRIQNDLIQSRNILKKDFNADAIAFAFPFNDYGQNSVNEPAAKKMVADAVAKNYLFAFYQVPIDKEDFFNFPDPSDFMIKRIEPSASMSGQDLAKLLDKSSPKSLPYSAPSFGNEWISNWASVTSKGSTLLLRAKPTTSGAATLLNGSEHWINYSFDATVNWQYGNDVSLIARYQSDSKTFLSCVLSNTQIAVETHTNGKQTIIAHSDYIPPLDRSNVEVRMTLNGGTVSCSSSGTQVSANVGPEFVHDGQIGLQVWSETLGTGSLEVKKVAINPV